MYNLRRFIVCSFVFMLPTCAFSQQKDHTKPIVDAAIKAVGAGKFQKMKGLRCTMKASVPIGNAGNVELSGSWMISGIDLYRAEMNVTTPNGQAKNGTLVFTSANAWAFEPNRNKVEELPAEARPTIRTLLHALRFAHMPHLLRSKDVKLSPLGEMKIAGKDAAGITVEQKGLANISIHFDKKSGLPLQADMTGVATPNGKESDFSFRFGNYKKIKGVNHLTRIGVTVDGKKVCDVDFDNIELVQSIEPAMFKKPG